MESGEGKGCNSRIKDNHVWIGRDLALSTFINAVGEGKGMN